MPSKLATQALELGSRLVITPGSLAPSGAAAQREAGYILLGAVAVVLPQEALVGGAATDMLTCWHPALQSPAAAQLDVTKCSTVGSPGFKALRAT